MIHIQPFSPTYADAVPAMILNIQQNEFNVPVTLADQPDLLQIPTFYQRNRGQFWLALAHDGALVGTIALIDNGDNTGTIRKMFVRADYRGKEFGTAQKLYDTLEQWAIERGFASVWLGTYHALHAALRFYDRNGFFPLEKAGLPPLFPIMPVDDRFYGKYLPKYCVREGTAADIPGVLALQARYLWANLNEEERKAGFVTTPFTPEQIETVIADYRGLYVAIGQGGAVVGYAYGAAWQYWAQWPMFQHMIGRMHLYTFEGRHCDTDNSYQYGPICVDKSMRGQGVAEALFEAVRRGFAERYPIGLTFINKVNELSMAFHIRKLGLVVVDEFDFNEKNYATLGYSSNSQQ
jgi:GNAT superfamily N-acetyltransferase